MYLTLKTSINVQTSKINVPDVQTKNNNRKFIALSSTFLAIVTENVKSFKVNNFVIRAFGGQSSDLFSKKVRRLSLSHLHFPQSFKNDIRGIRSYSHMLLVLSIRKISSRK